jgi:hypothetical protein
MTQKKINANIKTLLMWFKEDTDTFSKVYFRYLEIFKKKFQNDFESKFEMLLEVWANVSKTEYLHILNISEKVNKLEIQAMQFL